MAEPSIEKVMDEVEFIFRIPEEERVLPFGLHLALRTGTLFEYLASDDYEADRG